MYHLRCKQNIPNKSTLRNCEVGYHASAPYSYLWFVIIIKDKHCMVNYSQTLAIRHSIVCPQIIALLTLFTIGIGCSGIGYFRHGGGDFAGFQVPSRLLTSGQNRNTQLIRFSITYILVSDDIIYPSEYLESMIRYLAKTFMSGLHNTC